MNKEQLYKYFAGETSAAEEKEIMDWVETSPENYRNYLKERKCWNALLIHTTQTNAQNIIRRKRSVNLWMISSVAASMAILFFISQWLMPENQPQEKWLSVWVPPGQRAQVTLDDGTTVWLNSRSKLTFPSIFMTDKRVVKLDGEGFFEVEKDKEHPFVVQTQKYNIEVLGTSFNVLAYEDYEVFETALLSGSVQVNALDPHIRPITLQPNEMVSESDGGLRVNRIENPDHFRWREGLICLDDERFEDLIQKFSLYFDIKITIQNKRLKDYRCTGKFRQSDGVDYALKVLQREMRFHYTRNNESNEITIQ